MSYWKSMLFGLILLMSFSDMALADEVQMPAEETFQKALVVLMDLGAVPSFKDKDLLMIKTDPLPIKITTDEADCGSMFGIPYLKDKRTKIAATYLVRIKKLDDNKSDVNVKVTLDGYMDVNEGAPFFIEKTRDKNKVLSCNSKGVLEKKFLDALIK